MYNSRFAGPPRTESAPLNNNRFGGAAFRGGRGVGRGGGFGNLSDLRSGPRPGLPSRPPMSPPAVTEQPRPEMPPRPAPVAEETAAPNQAPPPLGDYYPEDRHYEVGRLLCLRHCQAPVPQRVLDFARGLWREMPENMDDLPDNHSLRDNLFKDGNATASSKVLAERKLHNEVLGILGKVTEANLEKMQDELTDLPIRQSTKEEITEVISVFFNKATRPEDSRYTPLYVKLIAHLIATIGEREAAGAMIRRAIIVLCRETFLSAPERAKEMEESIANLSEEEADYARMQFAGKQKANIYFLGLMFASHLVSLVVVRAVLDSLLYSNSRRRRVVPDYCVIHFMELLQTCGPHLEPSFYVDPLPRYRAALEEFSRTYPQRRIQFLLQNFLETMDNGWVPVHGREAKLRPHPGRGKGPSHPPPPPVAAPEPQVKVPDMEEFLRVVGDFFSTGEVDEIAAKMAHVSPEVTVPYCKKLLGRYITTVRYGKERARLGELFELLIQKHVMTTETAQAALMAHVEQVIDEDLFIDQPDYFSHWVEVIRHGRGVFPPLMHTRLLNKLVAHRVARDVVVKMVQVVHRSLEESSKGDARESQPHERFRVLQALLHYSPPLLSGESAPSEDLDAVSEEEHSNAGDDDSTILVDVRAVDVEVDFFLIMCEGYEESSSATAVHSVVEATRRNPAHAYPMFAAYFTFVRFDVDALCTKYRDALRKLLSARPAPGLLEEAYLQWSLLDCPAKFFYAFVKKLMTMGAVKPDLVERLCAKLRQDYKADDFVTQMEKYLK